MFDVPVRLAFSLGISEQRIFTIKGAGGKEGTLLSDYLSVSGNSLWDPSPPGRLHGISLTDFGSPGKVLTPANRW